MFRTGTEQFVSVVDRSDDPTFRDVGRARLVNGISHIGAATSVTSKAFHKPSNGRKRKGDSPTANKKSCEEIGSSRRTRSSEYHSLWENGNPIVVARAVLTIGAIAREYRWI
jgi:hypothetical protein